MKNKKRTLLLSLSCALAFVIALCGFNAYADITSDNNNSGTMVYADGTLTSGSDSVVIEQIEQERVDATKLPTADNLKDFSQKKPLYPASFDGSSIPWNTASESTQAWKVVQNNPNVIDKFVTVKNNGTVPVYVRTLIAYEGDATYGPNGPYIHVVHNANNVDPKIKVTDLGVFNVNGVAYTVFEYVYTEALGAGGKTIPSLKQVYMNKSATNDVIAHYGETYDIIVLSQACSVKDKPAAESLEMVFSKGDGNAAVAEWFASIPFPTFVSTAEELMDALNGDGTIILENDIDLSDLLGL